jgi:hypothetical protein
LHIAKKIKGENNMDTKEQRSNKLHIYAPAGYYHINHNKVLGWFDLTGWHEPNAILFRKKYERIKLFRRRCMAYVKASKWPYLSHKAGGKMKLMRRFRILNYLYAHLFGYFWLPCPICGNKFGGHEWTHSISYVTGQGIGVCYRDGCIDEAKRITAKNFDAVKGIPYSQWR